MVDIRARGAAIRLIGDREVRKALERFKTSVRNRVVRAGVTTALRPIAKEAKRLVPTRFRFLKKSLGTKVKTYRSGVWGAVGVRTGERWWGTVRGKTVKPHKYAHAVELGTKTARPHPFLRPALDSRRATSIAKFNATVAKRIPIEVAKARAKAGARR